MKFRNLKPDEIQVRMDSCSQTGARFLLYKDARCDMDILDESVGVANWQRRHYENKGNLYCSVGINVNFADPGAAPQWVWKDDCGAESNTEKEKGEASDSFKRACVNWGIGRELYTKIPIFFQIETRDTNRKKNNGKTIYEPTNPYARFCVSKIEYSEKKITALEISDERGIVAFRWPKGGAQKAPDMFVCADCGQIITPWVDKQGNTKMSVRQIAQASEAEYGKRLCLNCIQKVKANADHSSAV